ncbi:sulfite exporter TauE/SafE family protein [uncultured Thiothrix sp.]|uniref:sulfite exporter TauE/SafE family protein n=1 Tax=uncultured Thiothrix sp. TaxID=223185 RepID=UPI002633B5F3|nr:sulfite exporter TauE/SafE family protein [uncultured Thiothrix sp.]HMT94113.1 sulfite exporter TauE/SafE family protein [Thiolinea sp.]
MDLTWLSQFQQQIDVLLGQSQYLAAFAIGLFSGVHCLGMCGGLISAVGFTRQANHQSFPILLAYNLGRISSYALAGALAGGLGAAALSLTGLHAAQQVLYLFAALFMIALGLYLAGIWRGIAQLERGGAIFWRKLEPFSRRFIPIQTPLQALPFGMIWGWLPCGLVYTILIWSLSAGSAVNGLLLMLAFGLGTLPNLLLMGIAASRLNQLIRKPVTRLIAGLIVSSFGLIMLARLGIRF